MMPARVLPTLDRRRALRLCEVLAAYTEVVSSVEYLVRPADRRPGGVEYWGDAEGLTTLRSPRTHALVRRVADARATEALHALRAAAAGTVLAATHPGARLAGGLVSAACHALLHPRHRLSSDGSDHAAFVVQTAVALTRGAGATPAATDAGLWFVAASSGLSYTAAGVAKLVSPGWHRGDAALGVVRLRGYGDPALARHLDRIPGAGRVLDAAVLALECGFPLAWADRRGRAAPPVVLVALAFHLANARVMGLNRFLTAFAATYPAVLYTAGPRRGAGTRDRRATALAAVLAGWWVAMAAGNLPWVDPKRVRARERWGSVVPNWKFFTPNPIDTDDYLHVRTVGADGTVGPWHNAVPVALRVSRHAVWYPERRRDRALSNVLPGVARAAAKGDIMAAAGELRLLDGIAAHVVRRRDPRATAYQFSVVRRRGEDGKERRPYVSSVRPLAA